MRIGTAKSGIVVQWSEVGRDNQMKVIEKHAIIRQILELPRPKLCECIVNDRNAVEPILVCKVDWMKEFLSPYMESTVPIVEFEANSTQDKYVLVKSIVPTHVSYAPVERGLYMALDWDV